MRMMRRSWKMSILLALVMVFMTCMPVMASGLSDDNSLSSLNVHNGNVEPEFSYDRVEYNVTVDPGTTELYLEPQTSNENASIDSITGTVLQDGKATVTITVTAQSGSQAVYTLHVTESGAAAETETETEAESSSETQEAGAGNEASTEGQSESQEGQSESQTETNAQTTEATPQTNDSAVTALQAQVNKLKSNNDTTIKILYGLIALAVILLFIIINLILKNRDLKDDLRDTEDQLAYQTNEFARKEKSLGTDSYYAPTQQPGRYEEVRRPEDIKADPTVEETFGAAPEQKPSRSKKKKREVTKLEPEAPKTEAPEEPREAREPREPKDPKEKKDVDVTMVEL